MQNDRIIIDEIQLFDGLLVIILKDKAIGLEERHLLDLLLLLVEHTTNRGGYMLIEVVVFVLNPLLYDTAVDLVVIIVVSQQLTRVLTNAQMDVCQL